MDDYKDAAQQGYGYYVNGELLTPEELDLIQTGADQAGG